MATRVSIIIPTLNESEALATLLPALRRDCPGAELIVADGGSADDTPALARDADRSLTAPRGRALQMNAGAAAATGEVLWFLHADSSPPRDAFAHIEEILASGCSGGCFRIWFDERAWVFRISDAIGNFKVDLSGIAYGDHGIFCTADAFYRVGGFPAVPIFEDADFYRALGRWGGVRQARSYIVTSARRYHAHGPWRTTLLYMALTALYVLGFSRQRLARLYSRSFDVPIPAVPSTGKPAQILMEQRKV